MRCKQLNGRAVGFEGLALGIPLSITGKSPLFDRKS